MAVRHYARTVQFDLRLAIRSFRVGDVAGQLGRGLRKKTSGEYRWVYILVKYFTGGQAATSLRRSLPDKTPVFNLLRIFRLEDTDVWTGIARLFTLFSQAFAKVYYLGLRLR